MKKTLIAITLIAVLTLTACGKKADIAGSPSDRPARTSNAPSPLGNSRPHLRCFQSGPVTSLGVCAAERFQLCSTSRISGFAEESESLCWDEQFKTYELAESFA